MFFLGRGEGHGEPGRKRTHHCLLRHAQFLCKLCSSRGRVGSAGSVYRRRRQPGAQGQRRARGLPANEAGVRGPHRHPAVRDPGRPSDPAPGAEDGLFPESVDGHHRTTLGVCAERLHPRLQRR